MRNPITPTLLISAALAASTQTGALGAASARSEVDRVAGAIAARPAPGTPAPAAKPAPPPCLQPQGEPLSAQKIMQDLAAGRMVELQGRIIDGSLDADAAGVASDEHRTSLRILPGRLRLDACRINGRVTMPRAVLAQDIVITCSEIVGDVELSDSMVPGIVLDRTKVVGDLRLARAIVDHDVSLKGTTIEGSFEASGARTGGIVMTDADVHRDLEISREVIQALELNAAQIHGSVRLDDVLVVNSLLMHEAKVGRTVSFDTVRVASGVDLNELAPAGGITASNLTVGGSLMLSLSGDYSVALQDIVIGQNLVMVDGDFGDVNIDRLKVRMGSEMQGSRFRKKLIVGDTDFGSLFSASEARFEGPTEFHNVRFTGQDPMAGALFASAPILVDTVLPVPPTLMGDEGAANGESDEGDEEDEGSDEP